MENSDNRSAAMHGLRGFCAIYVVTYHLATLQPEFKTCPDLLKWIVRAGEQTVPIFFVLSGVFIASSLRSLCEFKVNPIRDFALRRVFRILPLWWALLLWMFMLGQISVEVLFADAIFFFGSWKVDSKWLAVVPAWTLAIEVLFYVLIAIFAKIVFSAKRSSVFVLWISCCLGGHIWKFLAAHLLHFDQFQIFATPLTHMSFFVAGIGIERWHHGGGRLEQWLGPRQTKSLEILVLGLSLSYSIPGLQLLPYEILAPAIVLLVGSPSGVMGKILATYPLRTLGVVSYGIYILQNLAAHYSKLWFGVGGFGYNVFCPLVTSIAFGFISYRLIETPFVNLGHRLTSKNKASDVLAQEKHSAIA